MTINKKILLANGCSFTWGGGLESFFQKDDDDTLNDSIREELVWPHHLGKMLNRDTVNLGMGCGSNERIVRTTIEWISQQSPETLANTVAVIQWTEYFRGEYYIPYCYNDPLNYGHESYKFNFENTPERWVLINCWGHSAGKKDKKIANRTIRNKVETYSDIHKLFEHIQECLTLAYLFEKYNIKYCFWNYQGNISQWPSNFFNLIKDLNWYSYNNLTDFDIISKTDPHPNIDGHIQIAKKLYDWFIDEK